MKESIKLILIAPIIGVGIGLFYLLIWLSHGCELVKLAYFTLFNIRYIKVHDKFHPSYMRIDR